MLLKLFKKNFSSPLGPITMVVSDQGVHVVSFENDDKSPLNHRSVVGADMDIQLSSHHPMLIQCEQELTEYFQGKRLKFSVPLKPSGTEFQKKVWTSLQQIPFGKTESYSEQAKRMGIPSSLRAVAAANGRNPIAILIPCHRVIASTGHLHGYAGGLNLKRQLLEGEGLKVKNLRVEVN